MNYRNVLVQLLCSRRLEHRNYRYGGLYNGRASEWVDILLVWCTYSSYVRLKAYGASCMTRIF
jgi:hypothetical protein